MTINCFFPELEPPPKLPRAKARPARLPRIAGSRRPVGPRILSNPCEGCPCAGRVIVPPSLPNNMRLLAVGLAPGEHEEYEHVPFVGPAGELLRKALFQAGLDTEKDVGYANLGQCRPINDNFESKEWTEAAERCWSYLAPVLAQWKGPILALGTQPIQRFLGDKDARVTSKRGLWYYYGPTQEVFSAFHPSAILKERNPDRKKRRQAQFLSDLHRMADRILGREVFVEYETTIYDDPKKTRGILKMLTDGLVTSWKRWFFDIETYDSAGVPSRVGVATNPFHPDFRVRGVAIATSPHKGFWIELSGYEEKKAFASKLLTPAFTGPDDKGAFFGGFDENGLITPGWVESITHRTRDPWLAAVALDAQGIGHSLERLAVEVLGEPQPKSGIDRSRIKELSLEDVAKYAVGDATLEFRLDLVLQERLDKGEYL